MSLVQKHSIKTVLTLLGTTVQGEFCRRNAAIDAITAYCHFQEGRAVTIPRNSLMTQSEEACLQQRARDTENNALENAILRVFREKRPTICFIYLGEKNLPFQKRVYSFASPGDLSKHFKRKHLANIRERDRIECKVCLMPLKHKMHLQNHAVLIHGTVS